MKAKSEKRLLAEELRIKQGLSYNEISENAKADTICSDALQP